MGFNQYTQGVQKGDIYKPLPDELFLAQAKSVYDRAEKTAQKVGSTYNNLFGISTYGKDAEVLNQFQQDFQNQVAEMSKHSLATPEANSKINSLISQYSSNPDVLAIHQRAAALSEEDRKEKEAIAKGETYSSPIKRQAAKYFDSGVYKRDERFSGSGFVNPKINKVQEELIKNNKDLLVRKEKKLAPDGRIYTTNVVDGQKAAQLWQNQIENDPLLQRFYADQFDQLYEDKNWDVEGQQILLNAAQNSYQLAQAASTPEEKAFYMQKAQSQEAAANSKYSGSQMKQLAFKDYIKQDAHEFGNIYSALNIEDIDADAFRLENLRTSNNLYEYGEKLKMDAGDYESKGIPAKSTTDKVVYSNTGEATSAGAAYNTLKSAFEGKEVGLNDLAPKIAKAKNIEYDPNRMKAVRNEDGTVSLQQGKKDGTYTEIPNTKTDLNGAIGLWSGADKKSFDKFIGGLNKSKEAAAIEFLKANNIDNPSPAQIAEVIKGMK